MRRRVIEPVTVAVALVLAACQEQRTVVLEQQQSGALAGVGGVQAPPPARKPHGAAQCTPPWGSGPFTPLDKPLSSQSVPKPARALAEHVSGCGGVRFRIGADGQPQDVEILADYPTGFGFGEHVRQLILGTRWSSRNDLSWHYLDATVLVPHG